MARRQTEFVADPIRNPCQYNVFNAPRHYFDCGFPLNNVVFSHQIRVMQSVQLTPAPSFLDANTALQTSVSQRSEDVETNDLNANREKVRKKSTPKKLTHFADSSSESSSATEQKFENTALKSQSAVNLPKGNRNDFLQKALDLVASPLTDPRQRSEAQINRELTRLMNEDNQYSPDSSVGRLSDNNQRLEAIDLNDFPEEETDSITEIHRSYQDPQVDLESSNFDTTQMSPHSSKSASSGHHKKVNPSDTDKQRQPLIFSQVLMSESTTTNHFTTPVANKPQESQETIIKIDLCSVGVRSVFDGDGDVPLTIDEVRDTFTGDFQVEMDDLESLDMDWVGSDEESFVIDRPMR
mmetsp:Transcript_50502/g.57924  ORF Transcript_50502/g.57924 Transcript_50502/m.57924 type:complete len:353 (-) Transcript_50502:313-1371(-)